MEIPELSLSTSIGLDVKEEPSLEAFLSFGKRLCHAFSSVGFVYIRDHGISQDLITEAMQASKEYFLLPSQVKEAFPRDPQIQQGYVAPGREIFDQKEDGTKVANFSETSVFIFPDFELNNICIHSHTGHT